MPLYDFACPNDHINEERVSFGVDVIDCPDCGARAERDRIPQRVGVTGVSVPPMAARGIPQSRFLEAQHDINRAVEKSGKPAPDLFKAAQQQAATIRKHAPELVEGT